MSVQVSDRSVTLPISEITTDFYVRKLFNQDWAIHLGLLIKNGVELDPIFITRDKRAIDGRHRITGHELADLTEIKCKYVDFDTEIELIVFALKCNIGNGLPASKDDIEHTIQTLLDRGVAKKDLMVLLDSMPEKLVKTYIRDLETKLNRSKLTKAASGMLEGGLNFSQAATQYNVDEKELKAIFSSKVKRKVSKNGVEEMKKEFSSSFQAHGNSTSKAFGKLVNLHEDGDVNTKQVLEMFNHVERLLRGFERRVSNQRSRFEAAETPKKEPQKKMAS